MSFPRRRESILIVAPSLGCGWFPAFAGMTKVPMFKFSYKMVLLTLLGISFFASLGFWQLSRAKEKSLMLAKEAAATEKPAYPWSPDMKNPNQYQRVIIQGQVLPQVFLLDNQYHQHQFGFQVLSALKLSNGKVILVDRGWKSGNPRTTEIQLKQKATEVSGQVYYPSKKAWVLGPMIEKKSADVLIIEKIDQRFLSQFLHKPVYPFIIRETVGDPNLVHAWQVVALSPARHKAYALQWFAMALGVLLVFLGQHRCKKDLT